MCGDESDSLRYRKESFPKSLHVHSKFLLKCISDVSAQEDEAGDTSLPAHAMYILKQMFSFGYKYILPVTLLHS